MADFRAAPIIPGEFPKAGQTIEYLAENGDLFSFWLAWVDEQHIPGHPNRFKCSGYRVSNGHGYPEATTLLANPIAVERDGWSLIKDVDGVWRVYWCPCRPPYDHCP